MLEEVVETHKNRLKNKYGSLFEEIINQGNKTLLNRSPAQLYIIDGESREVKEHEIFQIDEPYRTQYLHFIQINSNDIFNCSSIKSSKDIKPEKIKKLVVRTLLTKGVSGTGKTLTVQKFVLDWAEGKTNQDVDFIFVLPFRELNLIEDIQHSLHTVLCDFHPELIDMDPKMYKNCKIVVIFDGLDESRIELNFEDRGQKICDVTRMSTVAQLVTNLIIGNLLPSACIWITSRPASASKIPPQYVTLVTEIQGFDDLQKEVYFKERINDPDQANRIITHIKGTRGFHIMCCMPVFCWISHTVFQQLLQQSQTAELPQTLTEMYIHFLLAQTNIKKSEQRSEKDAEMLQESKEMLLKLSELAFKQMLKFRVVFYEEDLKECHIDLTKASLFSRRCPEIFMEESVLNHRKMYCFVHSSFQEFLAAFYVFSCCLSGNKEVLDFFMHITHDDPLYDLLWGVWVKCFRSENGQLDLFFRFLMGISLESSQTLLADLLPKTMLTSESISKAVGQFKFQVEMTDSDAKSINLLLCLLEINEKSLYLEAQEYLQSVKQPGVKLSDGYSRLFKYLCLCSKEVLDELDLNKYLISEKACTILIPATRNCRKALLAGCKLTEQSLEFLSSVLQIADSPLRELDLSHNDLQVSKGKSLSLGLKNLQCKLQVLRLVCCNLTHEFCETLAAALQSLNSPLKDLDLSSNDLQDSGVKLLSEGLQSPHCKLERLGLSGCLVTNVGCSSLALALSSNPSQLRELDLSYNHPKDSGEKILLSRLEDPDCKLEKLNMDHGGKIRLKEGMKKYAIDLKLDPDTAHISLSLSEDNRKVTRLNEEQPYIDLPERFDRFSQVLCIESLTGRCYWEVIRSKRDCAVGVTYKGISRKGLGDNCWFGANEMSWCLRRSLKKHILRHNQTGPDIDIVGCSESDRIGVYLDFLAGTLSFYSISSDTHTRTHIYTFHSTFTEPLYAGIGFGSGLTWFGSSASFGQIK